MKLLIIEDFVELAVKMKEALEAIGFYVDVMFIPRTNLQRAYKISRKATQEEFDEFHILHKR